MVYVLLILLAVGVVSNGIGLMALRNDYLNHTHLPVIPKSPLEDMVVENTDEPVHDPNCKCGHKLSRHPNGCTACSCAKFRPIVSNGSSLHSV